MGQFQFPTLIRGQVSWEGPEGVTPNAIVKFQTESRTKHSLHPEFGQFVFLLRMHWSRFVFHVSGHSGDSKADTKVDNDK